MFRLLSLASTLLLSAAATGQCSTATVIPIPGGNPNGPINGVINGPCNADFIPRLGDTVCPAINHGATAVPQHMPGAIFDFYVIARGQPTAPTPQVPHGNSLWNPANEIGTILLPVNSATFTFVTIQIPSLPGLCNLPLIVQGASYDPNASPQILLTDAWLFTIGT